MNEENKALLLKRAKSFGWRLGMMVGAAVVAFVMDNLGLLNMPEQAVIVAGLILGEVSKWLNSQAK